VNQRIGWLANEDPEVRGRVARVLDQRERNEIDWHWEMCARQAQLAPPGDWRVWLILADRGFGKTRAGAEWVRKIAEENSEARIALVSSSLAEARSVMVEGESGLLACAPPDRMPSFDASLRRVRFANGAQAQLFSAAEPESLRGPQFTHAFRSGAKGILHQSGDDTHRHFHARPGGRYPRNAAIDCRRRGMLPYLLTCHRRVGWPR